MNATTSTRPYNKFLISLIFGLCSFPIGTGALWAATTVRTLVYHQITNFDASQGFNTNGLQEPIISRNGNKIAFARAPGSGDPSNPNRILTINPDGTGETQMDSYTSFCFCGSYLDISGDGTKVISSDSVQLRISDTNGARPLVAFDSGELNGLKISGDGNKVFFRLGRDTSIRGFSENLMPRGVWVINADGSGLRQIVGVNEMARLLGIQPSEVSLFQGEFAVDASFDGSNIIFNCLVSPQSGGEGQGLFAVNLDGSGLRNLLGRVSFLQSAGISSNGAKIGYNFATFATGDVEVGTLNFDGSGRLTLTNNRVDHGGTGQGLPDSQERMQLTNDGSKLLIGGNGLLYNTDGNGALQLNMYVADFNSGVSQLLAASLLRATMNANGTRFLYISGNSPRQLQLLEINPAILGPAPDITGFGVDPAFLLQGGSMATVTTKVPGKPLIVYLDPVLRGLEDIGLEFPNGFNNLYLNDSGTRGDVMAGDGIFTYNDFRSGTDNSGNPPPLGPRTLRIEAAVRAGNGTLHASAVEFAPFSIEAVVITSPLVATGTVGQPFTYQFQASGATSLSASNLPRELMFNTTLSAIVGNPTMAGTFQVGLSATNSGGTTSATLNLTIQSAPSSGPLIVSSTSVTGRTGQRFSFQVITTGGSPATRLSASGLPAGLSVDEVTGVISGTPTADGSSAVTLTATDGNLTSTSILQLTFTSDPAIPVIISSSTASLTPGQSFSYAISAPAISDPSDPTFFTRIGTLPPGLTFDSKTGTISGIFMGNSQRDGPPDWKNLSGGIVGNVQLFATNSHGTSTIPLNFFLAPTGAVNISTRIAVGDADNVLIAGFIITGNAPKKVVIRAIAPSLKANNSPLPGALQDPTLELHDGNRTLGTNDDWRDSQEEEIIGTAVPPTDDRESAIVATLSPGNYTAIVAGKDNTTGIAVVELYDLGTASLDNASKARLAQISTRGKVLTNDNVMIGGFIISGSPTKVIVRAIGPELNGIVPGTLQDTTLELHDGSGSLINSNDDWRTTQEQQIIDTTVPPKDDRESAIVATLNPGAYTAILRGKNNTTGVALVEVYGL